MQNRCCVFEDELAYGKVRVELNGLTYFNRYRSLNEAAKAAAELELIPTRIAVLLSFEGANHPRRHDQKIRSEYEATRLIEAGFVDVTLS